jgi:KRAB domain-containing zinc finger protein
MEEENKTFECKICLSKFSRRYSLTRHVKTVHKNNVKFECTKCGSAFTRKDSLVVHQDRCGGDEQEVCGSGSNTLAVKHLPQPQMESCKICPSKFSHREDLAHHVNTVHKKTIRFECTKCGSSFTRKYNLALHQKKDKCGKSMEGGGGVAAAGVGRNGEGGIGDLKCIYVLFYEKIM